MFLTNVLNPVGEQTPDLPSMKCDTLPMSICIPRSSTRDRTQFISGHIDGTIKMFTARPAHQWWKPETYDEEDVDFFEEEDEDGEMSDEDDCVAIDAFETNWSLKQSLLPIRAIDLFPHETHRVAYATREGVVGVLDMETQGLVASHSDHSCGYSTMKTWGDNMVILGDEEGACVGLDLRCNNGKNGAAFNKMAPNGKNGKVKIDQKPSQNTATSSTLNSTWHNDDFGDYITSMCVSAKHKRVVFASSDKHVSTYDITSGKYIDTGSNFDEINSVSLLKDDDLIITGSDIGPLSTFAMNDMELMKDRYLFQEKSVDFIVPLDDDTILTGTEDGIVRLLTVNPTRIIGVVAVHKSWLTAIATQRGALEQDDFVWANDLVCCASADNVVRFWDIQDMQIVRQNLNKTQKKELDKKRAYEYDSDNEGSYESSKNKKKQKNNVVGKKKTTKSKQPIEVEDSSADDYNWDSDDDSDNDDAKASTKGNKAKPTTNNNKKEQNKKQSSKMVDSDGSEYEDDSDDDTFDLKTDGAMKAFEAMAATFGAQDFAKDQERLRKKYLTNVSVGEEKKETKEKKGENDSDKAENDDTGSNSGDDTSDFDWDNPGNSDDSDWSDDDDTDKDGGDDDDVSVDDDDDDAISDDDDEEGIDFELLDKMTEEEQDEYMRKFLGDAGSDMEDSEEFSDDDSDDDDEVDFSQIKNLRKESEKGQKGQKIVKKDDKTTKTTTKPATANDKKVSVADAKKQPQVDQSKTNTKEQQKAAKDNKENSAKDNKNAVNDKNSAKDNKNSLNENKNSAKENKNANKAKPSDDTKGKPLLPPPGPHIIPTILDATNFDHKKFRKAHGHELADANRSGHFAEKAKKRKEKRDADFNAKNGLNLSVVEQPKTINGLAALPDIQHKLPTVRKLKHGTSNFFNGLK